MGHFFRLPAIGAGIDKVKVLAWLKSEGDRVEAGDNLVEVETDKATLEVAAESGGVLRRILAPPGTEAVLDQPLAELLREGESDTVSLPPVQRPRGGTAEPAHHIPIPATVPVAGAIPAGEGGPKPRNLASPLARRLATREAIDLSMLRGTGPRGRILAQDVVAAQAVAAPVVVVGTTVPAVMPSSVESRAPRASVDLDVPHEVVPHNAMRRTIAARLSASKREIPHFYLTGHCELDALLTLRADLNRERAETGRLSINDFILRAAAVALLRVPDCNVMWSDDALIRFHRADIAVAVATDGGLITPVLRDAGAKSLSAIASEVKALAAKARGKGLAPADYRGGSLMVSNLGMFGVSQFAAIVNPPQAAILAVGAAEERLRLVAGEVRAATSMTVTLSVDHRAIDGAVAAKWLQEFKVLVETPLTMLV